MSKRTLWMALCIAAGLRLSLLCAAPPSLAEVQLRAGQGATYSGSARVTQHSGASLVSEFDATAALAFWAGPRSSGAANRVDLHVARAIQQKGDDDARGIVQRFEYVAGLPAQLVERESPQELESEEKFLSAYFPFDFLPPFSIPKGSGDKSQAVPGSVNALGQVAVEAKFVVERRTKEPLRTFRRSLAPGESPGFRFNGKAARLSAWSEEYVFDLKTRLPVRWARESKLQLGTGDDALTITVKNELTRGASDTQADKKLTAAIRQVESAFLKGQASAAIEAGVDGLIKVASATRWAPFAVAASARLAAYKKAFESTPKGQLLRRLLGKAPPDFTLEDLSGKKRRLRDIIKGKIAYLNFWGVG